MVPSDPLTQFKKYQLSSWTVCAVYGNMNEPVEILTNPDSELSLRMMMTMMMAEGLSLSSRMRLIIAFERRPEKFWDWRICYLLASVILQIFQVLGLQ